jgi:pyruvate-formate lyase-activating enzyme
METARELNLGNESPKILLIPEQAEPDIRGMLPRKIHGLLNSLGSWFKGGIDNSKILEIEESIQPEKYAETIVAVHTHQLTSVQYDILVRNIPVTEILQGKLASFDVENISDDFSIDFLIHCAIPNVLLLRLDKYISMLQRNKPVKTGDAPERLPIRMNDFDLWRYCLDGREYFQYVALATEICNYHCVMCPFHSKSEEWVFQQIRRPKDRPVHLTTELLNEFLRGLPPKMVRFGGNGEPFLNPEVFDLIALIKEKGHEICIQTNGSLLTPDKLQRLAELKVDQFNFGMEGITPETYNAIRQGGDLNKITEVLKEIRRMRDAGLAHWEVSINYIELPNLPFSRQEVANFYRGKADRVNFCRSFCDPPTEHTFTDEEVEESIRNLPGYCYTTLHGPVLGPRGHILPCGLVSNCEWFEDLSWTYKIQDMPLAEINERYKAALQDDNSELRQLCQRCTFWSHAYRKKGTLTSTYYHEEILEKIKH